MAEFSANPATTRIYVYDGVAEILDGSVTHETETALETRAKAEENRGELRFSRKADRMRSNFQLCLDVEGDGRAGFTFALIGREATILMQL